jgi:hypothetical protein
VVVLPLVPVTPAMANSRHGWPAMAEASTGQRERGCPARAARRRRIQIRRRRGFGEDGGGSGGKRVGDETVAVRLVPRMAANSTPGPASREES